jgi:acyl-coenzyme A synthetase/AMP-(fatty) acid ligase
VAAGAIFTGLASFMTRNELTKLLLAAEVSWLFAEPNLLDEALLAAKELGIDTSHVLAFDPPGLPAYSGPQTAFSQLIASDEHTWKACKDVQDGQQKTCFRLLTSGTTGVPKAAEIPHAAQIARIRSLGLFRRGPPSEVKFLQVVGMHHLTGLFASNAAVMRAHKAYITARSDARSIIDSIQLHSITRTLLPPHTMEGITQTIKAGYKSRDALSTLREVIIAGSIARQDSLVEFNSLWPDAVLSAPYGSTETGALTFVPPNIPSIPGYVGVLAPGVEIQ